MPLDARLVPQDKPNGSWLKDTVTIGTEMPFLPLLRVRARDLLGREDAGGSAAGRYPARCIYSYVYIDVQICIESRFRRGVCTGSVSAGMQIVRSGQGQQ